MDRNSKGFSFVEMMVVLAIIGLFLTFSARKLVTPNTEMESAVRRFTATVKKLRNRARIENKTYRLVFDLPAEKEKEQSYWVESTNKKTGRKLENQGNGYFLYVRGATTRACYSRKASSC